MSGPPLPDYSRFLMVPKSVARALRRNPNALAVFCALLDRAAWVPGTRIINCVPVHLEAGECVFGRDELALELGLTPSQIRTAIRTLRIASVIATRIARGTARGIATPITTPGTIATLLGYGETVREPDKGSPEVSPPGSPAKPPQDHQQNHHYLEGLEDPKDQKPQKGKRESLPLNWLPPSELSERAAGAGMNAEEIAEQWRRFVNHAKSEALTSADWNASADTWISRGIEHHRAKGDRKPARIATAGADRKPPRFINDLNDPRSEVEQREAWNKRHSQGFTWSIGDEEVGSS